MAKIKNKRIYSDDAAYLERLADELEFIGRPFDLNTREGVLTVFALPPRRTKRKKGKRAKDARNKRAESAARNS